MKRFELCETIRERRTEFNRRFTQNTRSPTATSQDYWKGQWGLQGRNQGRSEKSETIGNNWYL